jgi:hypothetical protein
MCGIRSERAPPRVETLEGEPVHSIERYGEIVAKSQS